MRNRLFRIVRLYLVGGVLLVSGCLFCHHREKTKTAARVATTDQILERTYRVDEQGTLATELAAFGSDTGLSIVVEWDALAKEKITQDTPVRVMCHDEPLPVILNRLLLSAQESATPGTFDPMLGITYKKDTSTGFYVDDYGHVVVTSYTRLPETLASYDVQDLLPLLKANIYGVDWALKRLLTDRVDENETVIDRTTYERIGAWCCDRDMVRMDDPSKQLFVRTTPDGHRRVKKLLQRLRDDPGLLKKLRMPKRVAM